MIVNIFKGVLALTLLALIPANVQGSGKEEEGVPKTLMVPSGVPTLENAQEPTGIAMLTSALKYFSKAGIEDLKDLVPQERIKRFQDDIAKIQQREIKTKEDEAKALTGGLKLRETLFQEAWTKLLKSFTDAAGANALDLNLFSSLLYSAKLDLYETFDKYTFINPEGFGGASKRLQALEAALRQKQTSADNALQQSALSKEPLFTKAILSHFMLKLMKVEGMSEEQRIAVGVRLLESIVEPAVKEGAITASKFLEAANQIFEQVRAEKAKMIPDAVQKLAMGNNKEGQEPKVPQTGSAVKADAVVENKAPENEEVGKGAPATTAAEVADDVGGKPAVRKQSWSEWIGFPIPYRTIAAFLSGYAVRSLLEYGFPVFGESVALYLGAPRVFGTSLSPAIPVISEVVSMAWDVTISWAVKYDGTRILNKLATGKDTVLGVSGGGLFMLPVVSMALDLLPLANVVSQGNSFLKQSSADFSLCLLREGERYETPLGLATRICGNRVQFNAMDTMELMGQFYRQAGEILWKGVLIDAGLSGISWLSKINFGDWWRQSPKVPVPAAPEALAAPEVPAR